MTPENVRGDEPTENSTHPSQLGSEHGARPRQQPSEKRLFARLLKFLGVAAALWLVFFALHRTFPYIMPGSRLVYEAKVRVALEGRPFARCASARRLVIFGNSQVLSGFQPELFDSLSKGRVCSYNMGLPDSKRFVRELSAMVERGQAPDIALVTVPWSTQARPTWWEQLADDPALREQLFPFYRLPRDFALYVARSREQAGFGWLYEQARSDVERTLLARGYYFIIGQSHHSGHRLPDDFQMPDDHPGTESVRDIEPEGPDFEELLHLAREGGMTILLVPLFQREGEAARPGGVNLETKRSLSDFPMIDVIGPDYFLLENRFFSDPVHLNPQGAKEYTTRLFRLLEKQLLQSADNTPRAN